MDLPDLIVSNLMGNSIGAKRVNLDLYKLPSKLAGRNHEGNM